MMVVCEIMEIVANEGFEIILFLVSIEFLNGIYYNLKIVCV